MNNCVAQAAFVTIFPVVLPRSFDGLPPAVVLSSLRKSSSLPPFPSLRHAPRAHTPQRTVDKILSRERVSDRGAGVSNGDRGADGSGSALQRAFSADVCDASGAGEGKSPCTQRIRTKAVLICLLSWYFDGDVLLKRE